MNTETGHRLLKLAGKIHLESSCPTLVDNLNAFAGLPNVSLRTIIDGLADSAYADSSMLSGEFLEQFVTNGGPETLVEGFVLKLAPPSRPPASPEENAKAKKELLECISYLSTSGVNLVDWVHQKRADYPNVDFRKLFTKDVREMLEYELEKRVHLPKEYAEEFKATGGLQRMIESLVSKIEPPKPKVNPESQAAAKEDLHQFICTYTTSTVTLHSWIQQQKDAYPDVDFRELFDDDIKDMLAYEIEKTATIIAKNKYKGIFSRDPERFILDFFVNRVLTIKRDSQPGVQKFDIDENTLERLISFIQEQGYPLENLYMLLYKEITHMRSLKDSPEAIQASVRTAVAATGALEGNLLFSDDFDYDELFDRYIKLAILSERENELNENEHLRLIDITDISPQGLSKVLIPPQAVAPVREKAEAMVSKEEFFYQLRKNFNYQEKNGSNGDSKIARLTDEELEETLSKQLDGAREQIKYILKRGLSRRSKNESIHRDCRFIKEIFHASSIGDLFEWTACPESFMKKHPQYRRKYSYKIIQFQCRRMMEMLLLYRKYAFREDVKNAEGDRDTLRDQLSLDLQIRNPVEKEVTFRIRAKVDKSTLQPTGDDPYEVVKDPTKLDSFPDKDHTDYEPGPDGEGGTDGIWYRYYPVETKSFIEVEMSIPIGKKGERKTGKVLIYSGDGKLIHCKSIQSYISSILRGKEPSDLLRWMIVTDDKEMSGALRHYLYENYSTGNFEVIKDNAENRELRKKQATIRSEKSQQFKEGRLYSGALYATVPMKNGENGPDHKHIGFETQIQEREAMLIANSHYTTQSHDRVYTPEREFRNIFRYLFPPIIYGQRYADYLMQGYDGKQNEAA